MLNAVTLMGRLTRDPELKSTTAGVSVSTITVACERNFTKQGERETDFIDVVVWKHTAEFVCRYFGKGSMIAVEGRLQTRKWQDKHGQNRVSYEVVAEQVYFAERKSDFDAVINEAKKEGVYKPGEIGRSLAPEGGWEEYNETPDVWPDDDEPF